MSQLTEKQRAFLQEKRFAVLATINSNGTPHQSTMWYLLENDEIVMNTKAGRIKDRNLRRDSRISVCFESEYNYLTISGTVTLLDDQEVAQKDILRLAERYHGKEGAQQQMDEMFSKEQRVTIRLKIERIIDNL